MSDGADSLERTCERYATDFARKLDGRWATIGIDPSDPRYAEWFFHGETGSRRAKGSHERFTAEWLDDRRVHLTWANGDEDTIEYELIVASHTTRQITLSSRGRGVFAFEAAPLVYLGYFDF